MYKKHSGNSLLSIWYLKEDISFFYEIAKKYHNQFSNETGKNNRRKLEWLAARHLLHNYHDIDQNIVKTPEGRPFCPDVPVHVSISHSGDLVCALSSSIHSGVDIQKISDQVVRIKDKFVSPQELSEERRTLHLIWSAKEAMYKAYGLKNLNFRAHLSVVIPDRLNLPTGSFSGILRKDDLKITYRLEYQIWNDYVLVTAFEENRLVV